MPCTPWRSTSSATLKASMMDVRFSTTCSRRSLGMMMRVSTFLASVVDAGLGLAGALAALEAERLGDHAHGEGAQLPGDLGDDRRGAGAGAAALAGGDEDHVGALEDLPDLVPALLGRRPAHFGVGAGAEAPGDLAADVQLHVGVAHEQGLRVGVDGDELDSLEPGIDHAVDGVGAAAADPDDLDHRQIAGSRVAHSSSNLQDHQITGLQLEPCVRSPRSVLDVMLRLLDSTSPRSLFPSKRHDITVHLALTATRSGDADVHILQPLSIPQVLLDDIGRHHQLLLEAVRLAQPQLAAALPSVTATLPAAETRSPGFTPGSFARCLALLQQPRPRGRAVPPRRGKTLLRCGRRDGLLEDPEGSVVACEAASSLLQHSPVVG